MMQSLLFAVLVACPMLVAEPFSYWIEPCRSPASVCEQADEELARWALEAWQRASNGSVVLSATPQEQARLRVYWASGRAGLYGEARRISVNGKVGAEVFVRPTLDGLGPEIAALGSKDPLFRHSIVYLTTLHELGHALGLPHTPNFTDIMYNFAFGGDILEYFSRYRRAVRTRDGIPSVSGLSEEDVRRVRALYADSVRQD